MSNATRPIPKHLHAQEEIKKEKYFKNNDSEKNGMPEIATDMISLHITYMQITRAVHAHYYSKQQLVRASI